MKLDLSKEATLDEKNWKVYAKLRLVLLILAIIFAVYAVFRTVFPSEYFSFSFLSISSLKNTITEMKTANGSFPEKGNISTNQAIVFYASPFSLNHSEAVVSITLDKKSASFQNGKIEARKSYKAFLYPEGEKLGVPGKPTVSDLRDGTIVTYGPSAYIISGEEVLPIDSEQTFSALGLNWADAVAAGADKISLYKKGKLVTMSSAHSNGTILATTENNKLFLIKDGKKYPLSSLEIAKQWSNDEPVLVSEKSLKTKELCDFKKDKLSFRTYSCQISLEKLSSLLGKDFEFQLKIDTNVQIDNINITFKKTVSSANIKDTLALIKKRIISNYVSTPQ